MVAEFFTGAPIVVRLPAIVQPEVSPVGNGYIYFDSGLNQFMMSENGGAYVPLGSGGGGANLATTLALGNTTGANDIVVSTGQAVRGATELTLESAAGNVLLDATGGLIDMRIGGTSFWQVNASGHLIAATDNANSIGLAGASRPSTVNVGTSVVVASSVTLNNLGLSNPAGALFVEAGPASDLTLRARGFGTLFNQAGEESLDGVYTGAGRNSVIGALNALVDGTVVPTPPTLTSVLAAGNTTGANNVSVNTGQKILGAAELTLDGTTVLNLQTGAVTRLQLDASGHLIPQADNAQDLGVAATNRFRTVYAGTSVVVGATVTINGTTNTITSSANLTIDTAAAGTLNLGNTNATTIVVGNGTSAITAAGDVIVNGDLTVNGTTTTINTTNLTVTDALIYGNDGGVDPSFAGIAWDQGAALDVIMVWNPTNSRLEFGRFNTAGGTSVPAGPLATLSDIRASNVALAGTNITGDGAVNVIGTGGSGHVSLVGGAGGGDVRLQRADANGWQVEGTGGSGDFHPLADNTQDVGTAALRVRTVRAGTSLIVTNGTNTLTINQDSLTQTSTASGQSLLLKGADAPGASNAAGSEVFVRAGFGDGTGAGGVVWIEGGNGGASGNGGGAVLRGGATTFVGGTGGDAFVRGGAAVDGNGGSVNLEPTSGVGTDRSGGSIIGNAGAATGTGTAGSIQLAAGNGGTTSAGGVVTLFAGQGGSTDGNGGTMSLGAGDAQGTGTGGQLNLSGGISPAGTGGEIRLQAGNAALADRVRVLPTGRVSIGASSPNATLDVQGSFGHGVTSISAGTTADDTATVWLVDASGGPVTLNLPAAATATRRIYHIKKTDNSANAVTIDADGAETIDGATTQALITQYESIQVVSDGTEWFIL